MDNDFIRVRGARQHNLKNVDADIPKNKLVVFTGVSGSGKSSMAFDTIYAEGQRRYVESLSSYARQFLGVMDKPDVDSISGLSPSISIDQKTTSRNPRSTVGTITEIYDYLRLLYARVGQPVCHICGRVIKRQTIDEIKNSVIAHCHDVAKKSKQGRIMLLAPVVQGKKGEFSSLFENLKTKGYEYIRIDNTVKDLDEEFVLIKTNKHNIDVVIDKLSFSLSDLKNKIYLENLESRITSSIEQALKLSEGLIIVSDILDTGFEIPVFPKHFLDHLYSERLACPVDNIQIPELEPRLFSFNSPQGACLNCSGLGKLLKVQPNLVLEESLSVTEGGIKPIANIFSHDTWYSRLILAFCESEGINPRTPINRLSEDQKHKLLYGGGLTEYKVEGTNSRGRNTYFYEKFDGIIPNLEKRHSDTESDWARAEIEKYMVEIVCAECNGARLKKEALSVTINGKNIHEITSLPISKSFDWITGLKKTLTPKDLEIGLLIINEVETRLKFLISVGLDYLTLGRTAGTLAGGEAQRIRLASQIGSGLTGVLYVLDEPTIGLHQKDNIKLIKTLKNLRDLGNTVIVVEHDAETIENADYIFDFGPQAGKLGGKIVAHGTLEEIKNNKNSITGPFLSGKRKVESKIKPSEKDNMVLLKTPVDRDLLGYFKIFGCSQFNLKGVDVTIPLGKLVSITGVSGSGKSTLLVDTIYPAIEKNLNRFYKGEPGIFKRMEGEDQINKVVLIDQSPIGRTPRSNPVTYTKAFDYIRDIFAGVRESRLQGFNKGRFSFNTKGGRCEACEGQGQIKIEMQFMSDIWVKCEVCKGQRFNSQTLDVSYKGKNIYEILNMTVNEAVEFFHTHTPLVNKLQTLQEVGLGYIELGQSATTLSGGEAQRIKLSSELSKRDTGHTLYILDEPTTGLHFLDIERLINVLKILVAKGNTVVVIEHNLDVIRAADWIIDLGPEGGDKGGEIVAQGTQSDIRKSVSSVTGKYL
jgi:excinuclease ABC subunit A